MIADEVNSITKCSVTYEYALKIPQVREGIFMYTCLPALLFLCYLVTELYALEWGLHVIGKVGLSISIFVEPT